MVHDDGGGVARAGERGTSGLAERIARVAHAGQVDKLGRDYAQAHLAPIANGAATLGVPFAQDAAWLHDVLEDTGLSAADLMERGIPAVVVAAVESVTRRADETYDELISRACLDPVGRFVKLVDNAWNITCNPVLAGRDPARAATMLTDRYLPARVLLLAACELAEGDPRMAALQEALDDSLRRLTS
jgi:hypothetical protein